MSYQIEHGPWTVGARMPRGEQLFTCAHCGLLRVEHADGISSHYISADAEGAERVVSVPPACIKRKPFTFRPPRW